MAFDEWQDLYNLKENNFHRLDKKQATVIFMDCRNVTANHGAYDLPGRDPVYDIMAECAYGVAEALTLGCIIYSGCDECSVIFPDTAQLFYVFGMDDCADYVLSLYTQRFLKLFWNRYPGIWIKTTIFPLPPEDVQRYLTYRQEVCRHVALAWQAKEYLGKDAYVDVGWDTEKLRSLLERNSLYDGVVKNKKFYEGVLKICKRKSPLDTLQSVFSS